jgi:rhamnosyltransferase subunit B
MARVLIGWELGAHQGHITSIKLIADQLLTDGHDVAIALQQIDAGGLDLDPRVSLWQAPVWPRLLINRRQPASAPVATMGDILCRVGLNQPGTLAAIIAGWDAICAAYRPDLIIANFAPALLCAAKGRYPAVKVGDGFTAPPGHLTTFPSLTGAAPAFDEEAMLDLVDADLAASGRAPLPGLPALFAADHEMVSSFKLLDPYAIHRTVPHCAPLIKPPLPDTTGGAGEEIFVYGFHGIDAGAALWDGLSQTAKVVRIHMSSASAEHLARFKTLGLKFEREPLPFTRIAARSRLVVSHGGHGFVSSALLSGLPQMITWFDLEKQFHGKAIAAAGLGRDHNLTAIKADAFAAQLLSIWDDDTLARACTHAAPDFRSAMTRDATAEISRIATQL